MSESIRGFVEGFFKNLKCTLSSKDGVLVVSNVPKDFENFSGRQQPYYLVFEKKYENDNTELMVKGSYLLRTMIEFLDERGKTTLLKIIFDFDFDNLFNQKFNLTNCDISNSTRRQEYKLITRFTFLSSFQYLNKKENSTNSICIKDGEIIHLNLDKFDFIEGRTEDIKIQDLKENYNLARNYLKELSQKRTLELHEILKSRINKEVERVKKHFENQRSECENNIKKLKKQIENLESEKKKNSNGENLNKILRLKENLKSIENSEDLKKISKEEEFFINDEIHKHSLSVNHKLINTSVFYYPEYVFTLFLKGSGGGRIMEVGYDPLFNVIENVRCDACKLELKDIVLCSGGHISCRGCILSCKGCMQESCKKCVEGCALCGKECCKKCIVKCNRCNKKVCKIHSVNSGAFNACVSCLKKCSSCGKSCDPGRMYKCPKGSSICDGCQKKIVQKRIGSVFER